MRLLIALLALTITTPLYAQTLGSTSGASSTVNVSDPPVANSTTHLITTPTVVAPGLAAAGVETCLGSASGGISMMGGGVTFGSTVVDPGCTIRLLARQLYAFGFQKAALALMCQDERVAVAMDRAGSPCPSPPAEVMQSDRGSSMPALSFAQEEQAQPLADEERAETLTPKPELKPFTPQEQAMFTRASNIN